MKNFFRKVECNLMLQLVVFTVLMGCFITIYLVVGNQLHKRYEIVNDDFSWVYQIDKIVNKDGNLEIFGWAFELEEEAKKGNCEVLLYEINTGEAFYPKMSYEKREDVNEYFLCDYDYSQSGFVGKLSINALNLENQIYEILLRPNDEKQVFSTGVYYADGEMKFSNPIESNSLQVLGTGLEQIVNEGILRVHLPEHGVYVYQYNGDLFWILDSTYNFGNSDEYIQLQFTTTQNENLPKERLENGWLFDNLGFFFSTNEIVDLECSGYRVAKINLPTSYSIKEIMTGYVQNEWIWKKVFRPYYVFEDNGK